MSEYEKQLETSDLANYHYAIQNQDKPTSYIKEQLHGSQYKLKGLGRGIAHYKHRDTGDNYYSIKGTNPRQPKDIVSDIKLGLGVSREDKQFVRRTNQLKKLYAKNEGNNYLIGHSLGGSIGTSALANSKTIRDRTKRAIFYNTGYTPAFHKELTSGMTPKVAKELNKKITHHHATGDPISASLNKSSVGRVKTYSNSLINPLDKHSIKFFTK